jgi:two-component system chemotaxis response regulator CheB
LLDADPSLRVIMASTLTQRNAAASLRALAAGAADYIPKPSTCGEIFSAADFQRELVAKVRALGEARCRIGQQRAASGSPGVRAARAEGASGAKASPSREPIRLRTPSPHGPQIVCIGSSTGGPRALMTVTAALEHGFDLPILITQHMPKTFTGVLADHLRKTSGKPCAEGVDGEPIEDGRLYIAPGARHMEVVGGEKGARIRLSDAPPVNFCKPAVDPMLQSAVAVFGGAVLAVILTGMGQDGLAGGRAVVEGGGTVIAQDESTSVVWGMPRAVAGEGLCAAVLPIDAIAGEVRRLAGRTIP